MGMNESLNWKGRIRCTRRNVVTGEVRVREYDNLITTAGKAAIARRLIGDATYDPNTGQCTYGAVGTGTTAPAASDIKLGTESFRKVLAYTTRTADNIALLRMFINTTEGGGGGNIHLYEFGLFGEAATGAADSGTIFNHAAIDEDKTSSETLTIEVTITIS